MTTIDEFKAHIGKEFTVALGPTKIPVTLDAVEALSALEGDDIPAEVNKNPFRAVFSGALDQRIPEGVHPISAEGVGTFEAYLDPCTGLDQVTDKIIYETYVA